METPLTCFNCELIRRLKLTHLNIHETESTHCRCSEDLCFFQHLQLISLVELLSGDCKQWNSLPSVFFALNFWFSSDMFVVCLYTMTYTISWLSCLDYHCWLVKCQFQWLTVAKPAPGRQHHFAKLQSLRLKLMSPEGMVMLFTTSVRMIPLSFKARRWGALS